MGEQHIVVESEEDFKTRTGAEEDSFIRWILKYIKYPLLIITPLVIFFFIGKIPANLETAGAKLDLLYILIFPVLLVILTIGLWYSEIKELKEDMSGDWSLKKLIKQRLVIEILVVLILVLLIWWIWF